MRTITDTEWEALQAKLPAPDYELVRVDLRMGTIVLRNPTSAEYGVFQSQRLDDAQKKVAFQNLLTLCCVFPERAELQAAVSRWPGIPSNARVVSGLRYLAGEAEVLEGKG